jgi:NUMOD4 motif/HNH endonuclease
MDVEVWKVIPSFTNYEASSFGRIRNIKTHKIIKCYINDGYCNLKLYCEKKGRPCKLHRIIAETFIPNPEGLTTVNHKNKNKTDNRVVNLEWMTALEQNQHKTQNNFNPKAISTRKVWKCDKDTHERIQVYPSVKSAAEALDYNKAYNIVHRIHDVIGGARKSCYGYFWEYDDYDVIENEIWKEIPVDIAVKEGYWISSEGRVKDSKGKMYFGHKNEQGYIRVSICKRLHRVHVLVGKVFLPNFLGKPHINHKDGKRDNNRLYNLEWSTREENIQHAYDTGLINKNKIGST